MNWMQEAHAEAMQLGLPCPFDCYECEMKQHRHEHKCLNCGRQVECYDETCFWENTVEDPITDCYKCRKPENPYQYDDPWAEDPPF